MLKIRMYSKLIILIIIYFLLFNLKSQTIKGIIIDTMNNKNIPYVEIYNEHFGAITGDDGFFSIEKSIIDSSKFVYFQCIGYYTKKIPINQFVYDTTSIIFMHKQVFHIKEVTISATSNKTKTYKTGIYKKDATGFYSSSINSEVATYIENKYNKIGIIKNVQFYIRGKGNPQKKFRIHIYEATNKDEPPGVELLPESIYARAKKGEEWLIVNLTKYSLIFPKKGIFIAIEWLPDSMTILNNNKNCINQNQNIILGLSWEKPNKGFTWTKKLGYKTSDKWRQELPYERKNVIVGTAMISAEIIIKDD